MRRKTKQIMSRVGGIVLLAVLSILINQYITVTEKEALQDTPQPSGIMEVHFIDVGQGDAILVEVDDFAMIIDAGENNRGNLVKEYLENHGVTKLDYVIGTHPHSDHIGGLDTILDSFEVHKILLPKVVHTTKTFEAVLDAVERQNLNITAPQVGDHYYLGSASFTILGPVSDSYDELNNYSIAVKITFGDNSFLFAGDAEALAEREMLQTGLDLKADVLKLSHHGSAYSSSEEFIEAVAPAYAVISVGKDNDYGHPHTETLQAMAKQNIRVYRTDEQGSIVFSSDGHTISVNTQD